MGNEFKHSPLAILLFSKVFSLYKSSHFFQIQIFHLLKIAIIVLLFISNCSTLSIIGRSETDNYYSNLFECENISGWRNQKKFDQFLVLWKMLKEKYAEENSRIGQADVVIAGDSLVHLFSEDLIKKEFPNINIVQRGIGGDMSDLLIERMSANVLNLNPKTVIIEIGGNDLIQGKCLSYLEGNLIRLVETVKQKNPNIRMIFLSVPPTKNYKLNAIVPVYNYFLSMLVKKYQGVYFVDAWSEMREKDYPTIKKEFTRENDKIHFNEKGYELWGKLLRPLLK